MQSILTSDPRHPSGPIGPSGPSDGNNKVACALCRVPNFCSMMAPVCAATKDPQQCLQDQVADCKKTCGVDIQCSASLPLVPTRPLLPLTPAPTPPPFPPQIPVLPSPSIPLRPSNIAPPLPPDIHPISPLMPLKPASPLEPLSPPQKTPNPSMMRTLLEDLGIFVAVALLLYFLYQAALAARIQDMGDMY